MTGPILFLVLPILAAAVVYSLRQLRMLSSLLSSGISLALGLMLLLLPFGEPVEFFGRTFILGGETALLGRSFILGPSVRSAMAFLFFTGTVFFALAWRLEGETLFVPVALGTLGLLGGVLLIRPLIYAVLLLEIAVTLSIFPLHADPRPPVRGGLRYLTFFTLAMPGLLISHWLLDRYAMTPDQTSLLYLATALIGFSFALLLGIVPFHPWVPAMARDGAPLASAFLFSTIGGTVWFLLLSYLETYPWLIEYSQWSTVLTALGVLTAFWGGLLGTTQRGAGTLIGYAIMVDTGMLLVVLGQSSNLDLGLGMALIMARAWSLALTSAGLAGLRAQSQDEGLELVGLGLRAPWSTISWLVGGLALLGFPLTIGFAPRWGIYRFLFRTQPWAAVVLLLSSAGLLIGLLRLLNQLLTSPAKRQPLTGSEPPELPVPPPSEPRVVVLMQLFLVAGTLVLGFYPQLWANLAARISSSFTMFGP